MEDNAGALYIMNGKAETADRLAQIDTTGQNAVYEVIRVIDGVPLFLEDHYFRMQKSLSIMGAELSISQEELKNEIHRLVTGNKLINFNAKVMVYNSNDVQNLLLYISKSYYPGIEEVIQGIPVGLINCERENPNAKVINSQYKEKRK
ncbi:MAG: hypothetical protein K0R31_1922 [Clostridiales bacterium]|nr:hypothetical protein [Clostridiales bacterium]